jgi:transposase
MQRRELTDTQWEKLEPHLPPQQPRTGRPNKDHRLIVNAILWQLRTGAPWRDLPAKYGPWQTVYSRFRKWVDDGTWDQIFEALHEQADEDGQLDWFMHFVDGTSVRVHQHGAGAQKKVDHKPSERAAGG